MTMSISSAPSATAWRVYSSLSSIDVRPDGKPVATEAVAKPLPSSARRASGTRVGYTHTAAHDGTSGCVGAGHTALAASWVTLPGVSWPSSVVRSTIEIASLIAACWDSALIERFPSTAARSSTPTRSTGVSRRRMGPAYCRALVSPLLDRDHPAPDRRAGQREQQRVPIPDGDRDGARRLVERHLQRRAVGDHARPEQPRVVDHVGGGADLGPLGVGRRADRLEAVRGDPEHLAAVQVRELREPAERAPL